jgi:predicted Zn-dependent peptidase
MLGAGSASAEFKLDVREFKLDNGLTILMLENHAAPLTTYYTFFKVGARNERVDNSGISHFFEHMMFNGAEKYGPKMFDLALESNGGYSNAYTSKNVTAYYQDFSSDILELVIDLESDRMANLALEEEMVRSEAGVVSEERLVGTDNDNVGIVYEELFSAAFMSHPYANPVLGWMESIKNFNREDCVEYFRTYYAPNNAVVAIVGDFDTDEALALMKQHFSGISSGPPPPPVARYEPEQRGPRRVMIERSARHSHIMRGYHIGDKDSPDLFAMEIIQFILTTGESSRLYQTLVNDLEVAFRLWGGFSWSFDPTLFYFYVGAVPGMDYQRVEQVLTRC